MKAALIPAGLIVSGLALIVLCSSTPRFNESGWQQRVHDGNTIEFFRERDRHIATSSRLWHLGTGIATLGFVLGLGLAMLDVDNLEDVETVTTPSGKVLPFILANTAWLAFIPAQQHWWQYTLKRGDYPWWADATASGILGNTMLVAIGLPIMNAGLLAALASADLPANLWLKPKTIWAQLATILTALLGFAAVPVLLGDVVRGDIFAVPLWCVLIYMLLCARAAAASGEDAPAALRLPDLR